jgi:hypothetical protein
MGFAAEGHASAITGNSALTAKYVRPIIERYISSIIILFYKAYKKLSYSYKIDLTIYPYTWLYVIVYESGNSFDSINAKDMEKENKVDIKGVYDWNIFSDMFF